MLEGSRPIGAVVVDTQGEIVATGKSATYNELTDVVVFHSEIAHAEVNALLKLDNRIHKKVNNYTLYSSLEPCPVCFGAFYMSGIRNLKYAAKDKFGGSTNLQGTTPYLSRKPIQVEGPIDYLEEISIVLYVYFDIYNNLIEADDPVHAMIYEDYPKAMELGRRWATEKWLEDKKQKPFEVIYGMIVENLSE